MQGNKIGERIKALREARGLTQSDVANALHVKRETVTHWENGTRDLKTESTIHLAQYFGVSCDEILTGNTPEYAPLSDKLGLSAEALETLMYLGRAGSFRFSNGITAKELGENAQLYEQISEEEYKEYERDFPMVFPETLTALSALNCLIESDWFIAFFCDIYNYLNIGNIEQIKLIRSSFKNRVYQDEEIGSCALDQGEAAKVEMFDEKGRCVRVYASDAKELALARIISALGHIAKKWHVIA